MSSSSKPTVSLSPTKRALLALQEMQSKLDAMERAKAEPIAIVGIGCRFPGGVKNVETFWKLLQDGVDAITEVPLDRWDIEAYYDPDPDVPGKMSTRYGGFLGPVDTFDALFFGISPREAVSLDPQQRLLLEVSWEALEHANQAPERLFKSSTGVFFGISSSDYSRVVLQSGDLSRIDAYFGSGNALSAAAGRLSYTLGLTGPSLAVDTACSSSLVAVHLACQSLRLRECNVALAGGVQLHLTPEASICFSKARMLSADGRCKTFDAAADGYVRGEGCGVIVLKRLSDAMADGDKVLALIRGTGMNQDGPSGGLTVPSGPSQEGVIRQALANGGVEPSQISYIEAHGTGTALGDPIEVGALGAVFGKERPQHAPLVIGSVKTNLGHLEAAAGIASLIKTVLALQHEEIPPHLHFKQPNAHIPWDKLPLLVPTQRMAWPAGERPRLAGVSSFSFSGTNAHVVLQEAPIPEPVHIDVERPLHLLTLSAKTDAALSELAGRYAGHLAASPSLPLGDLCFTANTGRSHFPHRLSVVASSTEEVGARLLAYTTGQESARVCRGRLPGASFPKVAFLFTGQGSQYIDMGRHLYETQPGFRRTLDRCDALLRPYLEHSLLSVLYPSAGSPAWLDETAYTQPALFALEYALATLWQSWGIEPAVVMGHSVGEYVAACVAGVFSLEDGLKLMAQRGRLMQALPQDGAMVAVLADAERVAVAIAPYAAEVSLAAINGPAQVVVSGRRQALTGVVAALEDAGITTRQLRVPHAFHSPLMDSMLEQFAPLLRDVAFSTPRLGIVSNLSGKLAATELTTAAYWCRHVREPVQFAAGMVTLRQLGCEAFVEIGPKPTLLELGRQCVPPGTDVWLPSLRVGVEDWQTLLQSLGELYVRGVPVDWQSFDRDYRRRKVVLPTYPFQRQRYWPESTDRRPQQSSASRRGLRRGSLHPLLGERLHSAAKQMQFESQLSDKTSAFLEDYCVYETVILPASVYLEMALAAGARVLRSDSLVLEKVILQQALRLQATADQTVQVIVTPEHPQVCTFQIFSCSGNDAFEEPTWVLHASGKVTVQASADVPARQDLAALPLQDVQEVAVAPYYQQCQQRGLAYGPRFQALTRLWCQPGQAVGEVRLPAVLEDEAGVYQLHPVLLEACFLVAACGAMASDTATAQEAAYLPVGIERLQVFRYPGHRLWSHAQLRADQGPNRMTLTADVRLLEPTGEVIAVVQGLQLTRASQVMPQSPRESVTDWLYEVAWSPQIRQGRSLPPDYLPAPATIKAYLLPQIALLSSKDNLEEYGALLQQLDALSVGYVLQAFQHMGWEYQHTRRFATVDLAAQWRVVSHYHRLLERLLEMLAEEGVLQRSGDAWEVGEMPAFSDPQVSIDRLLAAYPTAVAELTLLERCGPRLAEVLRGTCDPLQLLFPDGDITTATQLYQDSPGLRVMNTLVQQAVVSALVGLPPGRGVRILEIGAGTGGTTAYLLPHLPAYQTDYVFTDVSPLFLTKAQEKFRDFPFVRYQVLDIEQVPESQELGTHQYDIIVAANVLHATRELRQTLQHVQQLLAPGGILVLLEGTSRQRWVDLIFGLTEGWWRFTDKDLRPAYPLLSASQWQALLEESGFLHVETIALAPSGLEDASHQAVLIAQGAAVEPAVASRPPGRWVILTDRQGTGEQLAAMLRVRGEVCTLVFAGEAYERVGEDVYRIAPVRTEDFQRLLKEVIGLERPALRGVVHLWSLDAVEAGVQSGDDLELALQAGCGGALQIVQGLVEVAWTESPGLWLVTRGAQPVSANSQVPGVAQSSLWGMSKVIALEHPELRCVRVDLPPEAPREAAAFLIDEIWAEDREDQVAVRDGVRYVSRLVRNAPGRDSGEAEAPALSRVAGHDGRLVPASIRFQKENTYLITGGLGGLGLLVASWMVERGARHLVLLGRRGVTEAVRREVQALEQAGAQVKVMQADVSRYEQISRVLNDMTQQLPPLRGIIHAAGVLDDGVLRLQNWERFERVLRPKVAGAWNLHTLTRDIPLDFFVLFSGIAGVLGSPGQANHAAANAFLDALAACRRAQGLPGLSISWGAWSKVGAAAERQVSERLEMHGVGMIAPTQGLEALERLFQQEAAHVGVIPFNWPQFLRQFPEGGAPPLLAALACQMAQPGVDETHSTRQLECLRQLHEASPDERQHLLMVYVQGTVTEIMGLDSSQLDVQRPLNTLGLDSLMAVELRNRVRTDLEADVSIMTFLEGVSVAVLAAQLSAQFAGARAPSSASRATEATPYLGEHQASSQIDLSTGVPPEKVGEVLATLDQLSDEEVDDLLSSLLSEEEDGA